MKKYTSLFPVLLILLFIVSGFPYEAKGQVEDREIQGNWNGTISFHEKYEGALIRSGSWNETMINVTITDNKGQGTIKIDGELIIGGKNMGRVSCSGEGVVMLYDVVINPSEGTYRIVTTGPDCFNGTDLHSTGDVTIDYNYGGHTLNVLSGTKTTVFQIPTEDKGTVTTTIRWNLVRSIVAELIVIPEGYDKAGAKKSYDDWLPEPGRDEVSLGAKMKINLKLQGKNGKPLSVKAESFELRLSSTSKEPGFTLNAPLIPSAVQLPDLRFLEDNIGESIEEDQFIEIDCDDGKTGTATIASYDGGGWTTLTVVAVLQDGTRIQGTLLTPTGVMEIPIPKRNANSKIATKWLNENGNPGEMDDKEMSRGNNYKGDGLTAYEEYRGVISQNRFKRLDPEKKEVGIDIIKSDLSFFSEGIKLFEKATDLTAVLFYGDEDEIGLDRRLNKNALTNHDYDQFVLRLYKSAIPRPGVMGKAYGGVPGTPAKIYAILIDHPEIVDIYRYWESYARADNMLPMPFTLKEFTALITAHELGHGVNCLHHGHTREGPAGTARENSNPAFHIFSNNRRQINEITFRPYILDGGIGMQGNQQSGDLACIMAYNPSNDWAYRMDGGEHIYYMVPVLPLGKTLCISGAGTSLNATPNYFGDAFRGNCLATVKLRD